MDGPALLAEIKVRYPTLPVIVMTAYSTVKNAVQSFFSLEGWNIEQHPAAETAQGLKRNFTF